MALDTSSLHFLLHRLDERSDIGIARSLRLIQLLLNHVIRVVLHVFKRQVFKFALQLIETKLMSKWRIQIGSLLTHFQLGIYPLRITNLPHEVYTIGNHDQDHTHIFRKRQQQIAEILTLHNWILLIKLLNTI